MPCSDQGGAFSSLHNNADAFGLPYPALYMCVRSDTVSHVLAHPQVRVDKGIEAGSQKLLFCLGPPIWCESSATQLGPLATRQGQGSPDAERGCHSTPFRLDQAMQHAFGLASQSRQAFASDHSDTDTPQRSISMQVGTALRQDFADLLTIWTQQLIYLFEVLPEVGLAVPPG